MQVYIDGGIIRGTDVFKVWVYIVQIDTSTSTL
jgi:hypothetical protein